MRRQENTLLNFFLILFSIIGIYIILEQMQSIIIPLIVAFLIAFAIIWLNNFFKKKFNFNFFVSSLLSLFIYTLIGLWIWYFVWSNVEDLQNNLWNYQEKINDIIVNLQNILPKQIDLDLNKLASKINLSKLSQSIASGIAWLFSNIWLIFFYVIFMLLEYKYFNNKLSSIFSKKDKLEETINTINQIRNEVSHYFYIKAVISFFTAFFSYLLLVYFKLDFAVFWAVFIFILNFIPNIGSIIAVSFLVFLALFQYWFNSTFFILISWLIAIQIFMWNVIEPKYMWNKLNLSPLVILISLVFWWNLWWVAGMFLSLPIMIILNIVFSKFESTRPIAIILSEKWKLKQDFLVEHVKKTRKVFNNLKAKFKK